MSRWLVARQTQLASPPSRLDREGRRRRRGNVSILRAGHVDAIASPDDHGCRWGTVGAAGSAGAVGGDVLAVAGADGDGQVGPR
jgi:hypothetical protein